MLNTENELRQADILFDFDVLIFQGLPKMFHLSMNPIASVPVYADQNAMNPEFRNEYGISMDQGHIS